MANRRHYLSLPCLAASLLALLLAFGCSRTLPEHQEVKMETTTFEADRDKYPAADFLFREYRLKPGDVLDVLFQIRTWELKDKFTISVDDLVHVKYVDLPELNEQQNVTPDGTIALPYIGQVMVAGRRVTDVTEEVRQRYQGILRDPNIYITVPQYSSHIRELKADLHTAPRGLSRLVTVRPDGVVTFPLIGDVFVAHRTMPEVLQEVDEMYNNFLPGLHVNLFLQEDSGSLVYVLGAVRAPGAVAMRKPITVAQAVTLAGSYETSADPSRVMLFRRPEPGKRMKELPEPPKKIVLCCGEDDMMDAAEPVRADEEVPEKFIMATRHNLTSTLSADGQFFWLRPDDIVFVPYRTTYEWSLIMREVADIFLFNGWNIGLGADLFDDPLIDNIPGKSPNYDDEEDFRGFPETETPTFNTTTETATTP